MQYGIKNSTKSEIYYEDSAVNHQYGVKNSTKSDIYYQESSGMRNMGSRIQLKVIFIIKIPE